MAEFTVYDLATGMILRSGTCADEDVELQAGGDPSLGVQPVASKDDIQWVQGGQVVDRPELPAVVSKTEIAADDLDEAVISGLPEPCDVYIDGVVTEVPDGELVITSAMPATYVIQIEHWPYMPYRLEITANA